MKTGTYIVPFMIVFTIICGLAGKTDVYSVFTQGVGKGIKNAVSIMPPLIGLFVAVGAFRASGTADMLTNLIKPLTNLLNIPSEIIPFALIRPVSGSGSLALAQDIFKSYGTDSYIGRVASVMMASTETTFYVMAVYFGSVKITKTRYTLKCALLADFFCILISLAVCRMWF